MELRGRLVAGNRIRAGAIEAREIIDKTAAETVADFGQRNRQQLAHPFDPTGVELGNGLVAAVQQLAGGETDPLAPLLWCGCSLGLRQPLAMFRQLAEQVRRAGAVAQPHNMTDAHFVQLFTQLLQERGQSTAGLEAATQFQKQAGGIVIRCLPGFAALAGYTTAGGDDRGKAVAPLGQLLQQLGFPLQVPLEQRQCRAVGTGGGNGEARADIVCAGNGIGGLYQVALGNSKRGLVPGAVRAGQCFQG